MRKKLLKKFLMMISFVLVTNVIFGANNSWLVKEKNPRTKQQWVLYQGGGIIKEGIPIVEVLTPQANWTIRTFSSRSGLHIVKTAIDPSYGTRWHELSNGTFNVFINDKITKQVRTIVNTEKGIQRRFIYQTGASNMSIVQYDINYKNGFMDMYHDNGKRDASIYKKSNGSLVIQKIIYNDNEERIGVNNNLEATKEETELFNKYMKEKGWSK